MHVGVDDVGIDIGGDAGTGAVDVDVDMDVGTGAVGVDVDMDAGTSAVDVDVDMDAGGMCIPDSCTVSARIFEGVAEKLAPSCCCCSDNDGPKNGGVRGLEECASCGWKRLQFVTL